MITAIRAAILCDSVVTRPDGRVDLLGLWDDHVLAASKPGIVRPWLVVNFELDGSGADGRIVATAPGFNQSVPYQTPPGPEMTMAAFPILVPIIEEGALTVSAFDIRKPEKAFEVIWATGFAKGAEELNPELVKDLIQAGAEAASLATTGLQVRKTTRH
jgi:hypothetical protein